jgi:membrane protein required for beta-lactamase induction
MPLPSAPPQRPFSKTFPDLRRPSLSSVLIGLIPFAAICFSVSLWDRVYPIILGLPFNMFWLISWVVLTTVCMWGAYRLDRAHHANASAQDSAAQEQVR